MTVPPIACRSSTELNLARHIGQLFARSTQGLRQALCRSCPQGSRWATISSSSSMLHKDTRQQWILHGHILEASSDYDSAACAGQRRNLTFQAYRANVFKPSKGGSCGCRSRQRCGAGHCGLQYIYGIRGIRRLSRSIGSREWEVVSVPFGAESRVAQDALGAVLLEDDFVTSMRARFSLLGRDRFSR